MSEQNISLVSAQVSEVPVQVVSRPLLGCRYAYARSRDTQVADDVGQDYLSIRESETCFIFALCDGVGQSFYGDLAARYLGDALVTWLANEMPNAVEEAVIQATLTEYLKVLTGPATEMVAAHVLPIGIPNMLRDVLEQKRALGSESMFVCGRVDSPSAQFPEGRLVLAWMGDSRVRVWGPRGEWTPEWVGGGNSAERWSTRRGLVNGEPHVIVRPISFRGRSLVLSVMAYSDGLALLDRYGSPPPDAELNDLIDRAGKLPTSDDISVVELWIGARPQRIVSAVSRVEGLGATVAHSSLRLDWAGVEGADHYEVDVRGGETFWADTPELSYSLAGVSPGVYDVRVRAWRAGEYGPWSESISISVPAPEAAPELAGIPALTELPAAPEIVPAIRAESVATVSPARKSRGQALQTSAGLSGVPQRGPARRRDIEGRELLAAGFTVVGLLVLCAVLALLLKSPGVDLLRRKTATPTAVVTVPSAWPTHIPGGSSPVPTHVAPGARPTPTVGVADSADSHRPHQGFPIRVMRELVRRVFQYTAPQQ